ncbi:MAG: UDP-N-acetylglucosamine 1-carboxyvinyltransferase [Deltaproteobacteria bacterium]|nr:MAG: UDP-N-acetylglucosamine 1-carboxyvinyltransferase [Deltaproteobacteria bacterium]
MDKIEVKGGKKLKGEVLISGAKNAALPVLAASLLVDGKCIFTNVPELMDVSSILKLSYELGAVVERENDRVLIDASGLNNPFAPYDLVRKMRASILVLGPLVARLGKASVSLPGGCAIGARPVNLHIDALEKLGAEISLSHGYINAKSSGLVGAEINFDSVTVTGTENILMAAVLAKGTTVLRNAAREPEVKALADILNLMGAKIQGAGTAEIIIDGVDCLKPVETDIIPDRIETGTFMIASAITKGDVLIKKCSPSHLKEVISKLRETGTIIETGDDWIRVRGVEDIKSINIKTMPYPGFPTDMQAQFMVLMSIANGVSTIKETIFENRFIHANELQRMGADIYLPSSNTAVVRGKKILTGAPVMASDLRASASLVLAGLAAENTTIINRVYHLDRGYEKMETKLKNLGAEIKRVSS